MDLAEAKDLLKAIEDRLADAPFVEFHAFERKGGSCIWLSRTVCGSMPARKVCGGDARDLCDSRTRPTGMTSATSTQCKWTGRSLPLGPPSSAPANEMMHKLFDHFLDKPGSGAEELAAALVTPLAQLLPVRLVSHHLRLLGLLARKDDADWLVLVDCDRSK